MDEGESTDPTSPAQPMIMNLPVANKYRTNCLPLFAVKTRQTIYVAKMNPVVSSLRTKLISLAVILASLTMLVSTTWASVLSKSTLPSLAWLVAGVITEWLAMKIVFRLTRSDTVRALAVTVLVFQLLICAFALTCFFIVFVFSLTLE